jgi:hypothetical protein
VILLFWETHCEPIGDLGAWSALIVFVQCSETGKIMTLTSAKNDFVRTLNAVPGLLGKLCYVASLRNEEGSYQHWGLVRTHGPEQAEDSMTTAHQIIFREALRSPLNRLCSEIENAEVGDARRELLRELQTASATAVPASAGKASRLHFSALVAAVSALVESQRQSTHRVA